MTRAAGWLRGILAAAMLGAGAEAGQVALPPGDGVWLSPTSTQVLGNEAAVVAGLKARALKHVFLWSAGKTHDFYADYAPFITQAHANGLTVHAVCATKATVTSGTALSSALLSNVLHEVFLYNTNYAAAPFDGVQMDVEGVSGAALLALVAGVQVPPELVFSAAIQPNEYYDGVEAYYASLLQNTDLDLLIPMLYIMDGMNYSGGAPTFTFNLARLQTKTASLLALLPAQGKMMTGLSAYDREYPVLKAGGGIDRNYLNALSAPDGLSQPAFSPSSSFGLPNLVDTKALVEVNYLTNTATSVYRFDFTPTNWVDVIEMTPLGLRKSMAAADQGGAGDPQYLGTCTWVHHTTFDSYSGRQEGFSPDDGVYPSPQVNLQIISFQGGVARLRVSLTNAHPGEKILGDHASAGVHLRVEGASFLTADKGSFHAAEAFNSSGSVLANIAGAQIVQLRRAFFEDPAAQQAQSGDLTLSASGPFTLRYRAWMTDKDSLCNDIGTAEPYVARTPDDVHYNSAARFLTCATFATNLAPFQAGDYRATVLADGPVSYHRFNETGVVTFPNPYVAANLGTLGAAANGAAATADTSGSIVRAQPGALADPANSALKFSGTGTNRVLVPYKSAWNINGPFSVELWLKGGTDFTCPAASADPTPSTARGWLFYQGNFGQSSGNGWWFRVYQTGAARVNAQVDMTVNPNSWYHLVGVYDGSKVLLYVNGALVDSTALTAAYTPNTNAAYPLNLGARPDGGAYAYSGLMDEVACYTNALSASQVAAHYAAATTNALGYAAQILAHNPPGYWRFNDLFNPPVAHNSSSAGAAFDGIYLHSSATVPDFQSPTWPGLGTTNRVMQLFGTNGQAQMPPLNLNANSVTFECWLKRNGPQQSSAGLLMHRNLDNSGACGLDFHDASNHLGYYWNDAANTFNWDSGLLPADGQWTYTALAVSPSQAVIYMCDGTNWSAATNCVSHAVQAFAGPVRVGTDGGAGRWFNGSLDEVAIYDEALTEAQLRCHALAALGDVNRPLFTRAPIPQTVQFGASAAFSAVAVGASPLSCQWQKDGTALAGATSLSLTFSSVDYTNAGQYQLAVTNSGGGVLSSPAALVVLPPPWVTNLTYRTSGSASAPVLELIWPAGTLYCATNLSGPWSQVSGAGAPYCKVLINRASARTFFRIQ
jgi:hypothetical protein